MLKHEEAMAPNFSVIPPVSDRLSIVGHVPHSSTHIPPSVRGEILLGDAELQREVVRLTDWHTAELFSWIPVVGGTLFVNRLSRLVFDPERFADDDLEPTAKNGQGVVYTRTTQGAVLRRINAADRALRISQLYDPYHEALGGAVASALMEFGACLILDCHSFGTIPLPSEDDQSPNRPDICIGTDEFHTPQKLVEELRRGFAGAGLSVSVDSPFTGGLVPLDYYRVDARVTSVMIEVRRGLYCDESSGKQLDPFDEVRATIQAAMSPAVLAHVRR